MIDPVALMKGLSMSRPVFHSEADFQHALAWAINRAFPDSSVRLELPVASQGRQLHVDIWVSLAGASCAIELKYKTRGLRTRIDQEAFHLKDQAAQDLARYDFMKDIYRLEQLRRDARSTFGLAIFLSNDSAYWKRPTTSSSVDADFRIHEGRHVAGTLRWGAAASQGTIKSREEPIPLTGQYGFSWTDYSRVVASSYEAFRYLSVGVG